MRRPAHNTTGTRSPHAAMRLAKSVKIGVTLLRTGLTIAALVWIASYFVSNRTAIFEGLSAFRTETIAAAMAIVLIGLVPGAWAWQQLLARKIPVVGTARGIRVYLRSSMGKYTPGGALAFAIQHRHLSEQGVSLGDIVRVFVGTALAACLAAGLLGLPAMFALLGIAPNALWIGCATIVAVTTVSALLWYGRWPLVEPLLSQFGIPDPRTFFVTTTIMTIAWSVTAIHLAILGANTDASFAFLISAYALSAIVGIVFAILPGAFGVRDGALVIILATTVPMQDALVLALLSRSMIVAGDVLGTLIGAVLMQKIQLPPRKKGLHNGYPTI
ncbi:MAG: hypothetical protein AAFQ09_12620 [Pseudomonadota bacterium]